MNTNPKNAWKSPVYDMLHHPQGVAHEQGESHQHLGEIDINERGFCDNRALD